MLSYGTLSTDFCAPQDGYVSFREENHCDPNHSSEIVLLAGSGTTTEGSSRALLSKRNVTVFLTHEADLSCARLLAAKEYRSIGARPQLAQQLGIANLIGFNSRSTTSRWYIVTTRELYTSMTGGQQHFTYSIITLRACCVCISSRCTPGAAPIPHSCASSRCCHRRVPFFRQFFQLKSQRRLLGLYPTLVSNSSYLSALNSYPQTGLYR